MRVSTFRRLTLALLLPLAAVSIHLPAAVWAENPEITVYNQNFGVVKDYQTLSLNKGKNQVQLDTVAALIDPTSVHFKSLSDPTGVSVEEQNFRYDLINRSNLLSRMVGKRIRFVKNGAVKEGVLLNSPVTVMRPVDAYGAARYASNNYSIQNTTDLAVQTSEGVLLTTVDEILIDALPAGLYPRPTLVWNLFANQGGTQKTELSYITEGLNWACDYVAVLNSDDTKLDLTGWVTLDNNSGTSYENATLKLVAGDVRRLQNQAGVYAPQPMMAKSMMMEDARQGFQEESFFEYHLYTLNQKTSIMNRETKQLSLISANQIPVAKKLIFDPDRGYAIAYGQSYRPGMGGDTSGDKKVSVVVSLTNSEANRLGIPLPKGKVRLSKADTSGQLQFVGEDQIDHTARNESIELYVGDAFDVVGEKKRTAYRQDGNSYDSTYQVTLKNHKKQSVTVSAYEHLYGDWKISGNSHAYKKEDAHTVSFPVTIPADGTVTLTYTVSVKRN